MGKFLFEFAPAAFFVVLGNGGLNDHKGCPLSVTCTELPARVRPLTLRGSRRSVRSVIVFIMSDSNG